MNMDGGVGNLVHLLSFYTLERLLFNRMVGQTMGQNPKLVKMAVAFWLLLEEIGYHDLTRRIYSFNDSTIETIFNETLACLYCIRPGADEPSRHDDVILPVLTTILEEPISRRFFYYNSEFMLRRFAHVMDTVCNRIFGENSAIEVADDDDDDDDDLRIRVKTHHHRRRPVIITPDCEGSRTSDRVMSPPGDAGSSVAAARRVDKVLLAPISSILNPNASEFFPRKGNQDARTMFLTFSKGYPLTREEIINFFTSKWGDVVEDVLIEQAAGAEAPLYGRVVFNSPSIIGTILNGQSKAKFMVGRKHLWARVYVPRRG